MRELFKKINKIIEKHLKLFILAFFIICFLLIIIAGPKKKQKDTGTESATYEEVSEVDRKVKELYPDAESLLGHSKLCFLKTGETTEIKLSMHENPEVLSSAPLYDENIKLTAGTNDCIIHEISADRKTVLVKAFQPGSAVLYARSDKYNRTFKIYINVKD